MDAIGFNARLMVGGRYGMAPCKIHSAGTRGASRQMRAAVGGVHPACEPAFPAPTISLQACRGCAGRFLGSPARPNRPPAWPMARPMAKV